MVADALDHSAGAAVAHGESFAGQAPHEELARGGAVQRRVADDDVLFGRETAATRWEDGHPPTA